MKNKVFARSISAFFCMVLILFSFPLSNISALSEDKENAIILLSQRLDLPVNEVREKLHFNDNCYLVPLIELKEHKDCLVDIFCNSEESYMKYYLDGKLRSEERVDSVFYNRALYKMWKKADVPTSLTFIVDCDDASVGRFGVGPLCDRKQIDCEVGYAIKKEYSGKGLTSSGLKALINFLKYISSEKSNTYDFTRLRATAKIDNAASNKILSNSGFIKSDALIDDGYGPEVEYFYYF